MLKIEIPLVMGRSDAACKAKTLPVSYLSGLRNTHFLHVNLCMEQEVVGKEQACLEITTNLVGDKGSTAGSAPMISGGAYRPEPGMAADTIWDLILVLSLKSVPFTLENCLVGHRDDKKLIRNQHCSLQRSSKVQINLPRVNN